MTVLPYRSARRSRNPARTTICFPNQVARFVYSQKQGSQLVGGRADILRENSKENIHQLAIEDVSMGQLETAIRASTPRAEPPRTKIPVPKQIQL
jgi:hypothetical protein